MLTTCDPLPPLICKMTSLLLINSYYCICFSPFAIYHSLLSTTLCHPPLSTIYHYVPSTTLSHLALSAIYHSLPFTALPTSTLWHLPIPPNYHCLPSTTLSNLPLSPNSLFLPSIPLTPIYQDPLLADFVLFSVTNSNCT